MELLTDKVNLINTYVNKNLSSDLFFVKSGLAGDEIIPLSLGCTDLKSIVFEALTISRRASSCSKDSRGNYFETSSGRLRSALDLWRHIKTYYPEKTIYEVMEALYELEKKGRVNGHYCGTVRRRVFWPTSGGGVVIGKSFRDEFGLIFSDWENIISQNFHSEGWIVTSKKIPGGMLDSFKEIVTDVARVRIFKTKSGAIQFIGERKYYGEKPKNYWERQKYHLEVDETRYKISKITFDMENGVHKITIL